jgi:peptidyl-prolyl cis-trans isomerase C
VIQHKNQYLVSVAACLLFLGLTVGCGSKDEKTTAAKPAVAPGSSATALLPSGPETKVDGAAIAVEVNGAKMTNAQLDEQLQKVMAGYKGQIPADKIEQARSDIRKNVVEDFVVRTLIAEEVAAKKLTATDKEIAAVLEQMKSQLPPGMTMDEVVKKNQIDMEKMRTDIGMNIKINKLVDQATGKIKITDKDITDYYGQNKDKFTKPETVHARHILVSKTAGDTEKQLKEKKAKIDDVRKKLVAGADFADMAKKNSDCPSKESGGDLGTFPRGQMVKPFEDAAFSQQKNAIGPVVETDFGYHVIQVLDHQSSQVMKLDADTKKKIGSYLENTKKREAFDGIVKKLKATAKIVMSGK